MKELDMNQIRLMPAEQSRTQLCSCSSPPQLPSLPPHLDTLRHRAPPPSPRSDVMNFFKTKTRTPTDLARGLRDNILKLESAPPGEPRKKVRIPVRSVLCRINAHMGASRVPPLHQASEEVSKYLQQIKGMLYGDGGALLDFPSRRPST